MSEKREYPRLNCGFEVTLISNGHFFRDKLVDISEDGAQLELSRPMALARDILIRARLGGHLVLALGDIKWSKVKQEVRHIGIKFLYLPPPVRSRIRLLAAV